MKGKKLLSLLLALGMTVSVAACGGQESSEKPSQEGGNEVAEGTEEGGSVIDMEGDPYQVGIQVVTLPGYEMADEAAMEEAINAITVPAINCTVDIQNVWISEVGQKTSMGVASGEKIDIIHVGTVQKLSTMVGSDVLLDMNEDDLLATHGKDLLELFGEDVVASGEVDGMQLALPASNFNAGAKGMYYNKTFADAHGIVVPEKCSLEDMTAILEQVVATGEDIMPMFAGDGGVNQMPFMTEMTVFGTDGAYGVIYDEENPVVENLYESEEYKNFVMLMQQWREKGLLQGEITDTNPSQTYFGAGKAFCVPSDINVKQKAIYAAQYPEYEIGWVEMVEPELTSAGVMEFMWGIASSCERPDKVMDFLNFLYTNSEVSNILMYGLEGVNYDFAEGSEKVVVTNGTYVPAFLKGFNEKIMYIQAPNGETAIDEMVAFEEAAAVSPLLGYMFSDAEFQTESAAIGAIIKEYCPRLNTGNAGSAAETEALINELAEKLKTANIDGIIAENQAQLDAFLASK